MDTLPTAHTPYGRRLGEQTNAFFSKRGALLTLFSLTGTPHMGAIDPVLF
jgi:hypothetical protein